MAMEAELIQENELLTIARALAPEDVAVHQYVTVSRVTEYLTPDDWIEVERGFDRESLVHRVTTIAQNSGYPYRVSRVALPYVLVRDPVGKAHVLDLRRVQLALLPEFFGKAAYMALGNPK
ncbi:MAG: hypothetical protein RLN76_09265 [Phycisphaeraceae bacterium]